MPKIADVSRFSDLIERMYAAVLDPSMWMGVAADVAELCGTQSASIQVRNTKTGAVQLLSRTANMDDASDIAYVSYFHKKDVWANLGLASGQGGVIQGQSLISDGQLEKTEFYQDFLRKLDMFQIIGSILHVGQDQVGLIGVHRGRNQPSFDQTEQEQLGAILPHLQRALQLRQKVSGDEIATQNLKLPDEEGLAVLLVDGNGRLLHANGEGDVLLRSSEALKVADNIVTTHHVRTALRLQRLIKDAAATAAARIGIPGGFLSIPRADRFPLSMLVSPYQAVLNPASAPTPAALLMVRDPARDTELNTVLQSLFGLTPAESKIANALASGSSIEEIAARYGLSHHTVRTQLKSISGKTGTSRQGELIALVLKATSFPKV
jgi:DNA-binding CsgD family transcriptional regulator